MSKPAFVGRFLVLFALLIVLGWATDAPARYAAMLRTATGAVSPLLNGWWIETRVDKVGKTETWFHRGDEELKLLLSLEALALGLLPLFALLGATPGLGWKRLAFAAAAGGGSLFALDALILLLYPALVSGTAATELAGFFLGILTFVGGPIILWFVLTFDALRGVWRVPGHAPPVREESGRKTPPRSNRAR